MASLDLACKNELEEYGGGWRGEFINFVFNVTTSRWPHIWEEILKEEKLPHWPTSSMVLHLLKFLDHADNVSCWRLKPSGPEPVGTFHIQTIMGTNRRRENLCSPDSYWSGEDRGWGRYILHAVLRWLMLGRWNLIEQSCVLEKFHVGRKNPTSRPLPFRLWQIHSSARTLWWVPGCGSWELTINCASVGGTFEWHISMAAAGESTQQSVSPKTLNGKFQK